MARGWPAAGFNTCRSLAREVAHLEDGDMFERERLANVLSVAAAQVAELAQAAASDAPQPRHLGALVVSGERGSGERG